MVGGSDGVSDRDNEASFRFLLGGAPGASRTNPTLARKMRKAS